MRKKFTILGLALLAVISIACSTSTKTTSSTGDGSTQSSDPVTVAMGQTATLTYDGLVDKTVIDVTLSGAKQYSKDPKYGQKPSSPNGTYLVVSVTVVCKEGTHNANLGGFKIVASDGTVYDTTVAIGFDPLLTFTDLNAGQKAVGNIIFDLPKDKVAGAKIQIDGIGLDYNKPAAYWTV